MSTEKSRKKRFANAITMILGANIGAASIYFNSPKAAQPQAASRRLGTKHTRLLNGDPEQIGRLALQ